MGTPHARLHGDTLSIAVWDYHTEYEFAAMSQHKAHVRYVWTSLTQDLFEFLLPAAADEAVRRWYFESFLNSQLRYNGVFPQEADIGHAGIFIVSGTREAVFNAYSTFCYELIRDVQAGGPGADDGTYDYFPNAVNMALQMAAGFRLVGFAENTAESIYNQVVTAARESHYADNEEADDLLPYMKEGEIQ